MWDSQPGTYALVTSLCRATSVQVGRLGTFTFEAGWYVYAGSARGPGGLQARLARHNHTVKRFHWHIDYLLEHARLQEVWSVGAVDRRECVWASVIGSMPGASMPVSDFGASDCGCRTHLFAFAARPSFGSFVEMIGQAGQTGIELTELDK